MKSNDQGAEPHRGWGFLSNHAHVLVCLADDPKIRIREISARVGITGRAVIRILEDLEREGHVVRRRQGRRNTYELDLARPLRHPMERHRRAGDLVDLVLPMEQAGWDAQRNRMGLSAGGAKEGSVESP